jgi:MoaA/NifB/PqqE/SkfB family radical SAM enzyme
MKMNYLYDPKEHYVNDVAPIENLDCEECGMEIQNIGWTLGNDCPYRCKHCYSMSARDKGMDLSKEIIDTIINQLKKLKPKTINLGGNEPLFTNGIDPKKSLLPYILRQITLNEINVGLTSSGITVVYLYENHNDEFKLLNDIDISIDSPYEEEHNNNRGKRIFNLVLKALDICANNDIERTIIMCAMNWNLKKIEFAILLILLSLMAQILE